MKRTTAALALVLCTVSCAQTWRIAPDFTGDPSLGENTVVQRTGINESEALKQTAKLLQERHVTDIEFCNATRIVAPLGGWLIDARGVLATDGGTFTRFRIGVRDGSDNLPAGGTNNGEFAFLARGVSSTGSPLAMPPAGPGFVEDYEFEKIGTRRKNCWE